MYVDLTRVNTTDQPIGNAAIVAEEMVRWLRDIDGSEGILTLSREGTTLGPTFWESHEGANRHRAARKRFVDRMTSVADVQVEETIDFEVTSAEFGRGLTDFSR